MSVQLIERYYKDLATIKRIGRTTNEEPLSRAMERLLIELTRANNLFFIAQPPRKSPTGDTIKPDGMIGDQFFDWGYWEAKDPKDDLDKEIAEKLAKGYPTKNILFEDTVTAVLYQAGQEVGRVSMQDAAALDTLLAQFITYQPSEIRMFREEVETFKRVVPELADKLRAIITEQYVSNQAFTKAADQFLVLCQMAINKVVNMSDVWEMIIQHILTQDIFDVIFDESHFHRENSIAQKLADVIATFYVGRDRREIEGKIRPFYEVVKARSAQIQSHHEKQTFLKVLYETFYRAYNPKAADRLGIIYTPNEIVRFMIESADHLCFQYFGKTLSESGVHILDPATGTGTYIAELLQFWTGVADRRPEQFKNKYQSEVHCNELSILPYYIANLNIENTYQSLTGEYEPYENIVFVDTLDRMSPNLPQPELNLFPENTERINVQNEHDISVIIGNPPYNAWQEGYNTQNPNRPYRRIDERIKQTYVKHGTSQNQNALYDMYTRFYRWATDRLADEGIITFVTNSSFIDAQTYDGFRKVVSDEFSHIYLIDLGGNLRQGEQGNVFGIRVGVTIAFMVRTKNYRDMRCRIDYIRLDGDDPELKLRQLMARPIDRIPFTSVQPNDRHEWINQIENDFEQHIPIASKNEPALFHLHSNGIKTQRDQWMYDFSSKLLAKKVRFLIKTYEATRKQPDNSDKWQIKWDRELEKYRERGVRLRFDKKQIVRAMYRPFVSSYLYFDKHLNGMTYQLPQMFPHGHENQAIVFSGRSFRSTFTTLVVDAIPELHLGASTDGFQSVSLYQYDGLGNRVDNITDWGVEQFRTHYTDSGITKEAIFHYAYAVLHHPAYRTKYELNLKRDFPRIPFYADFWQWAEWGKALMRLHLEYETVDPFPLQRHDKDPATVRKAYKAKLKRMKESDEIELDTLTTLSGVPEIAYTYRLGNRSAIEWVLDRYKERKPRDPTIREKFNTYRFADYKEDVIILLKQVTTVSVETMAIIEQMPETVDAAQKSA